MTGNVVVIEGDLDLLSVIDGELEKVLHVDSSREVYTGDYIVTPLVNDQVILETTGKFMEDDVTVLRVPYLETSNPAGGNTAYIGEYV